MAMRGRSSVRRAAPLGLLALPVWLGCTSRGEPGDSAIAARVDSVFAHVAPGGPGCAVGVYRDGRSILMRSYGLANIQERRPITERTMFDLGSAAKPYTALAAFALIEAGRLSPGDDVRRFVPELPDYGTPIRVQDLLQHTSGLRDYGTLGLLSGREAQTMPEFVQTMKAQRRLNFTPGTRHEYSHSDFFVLALVVERVSGQPFGAFVEREVLRPLGLTASVVDDGRGVTVTDRAIGHDSAGGGIRAIESSWTLAGGSGLYTSVAELLHWDRALAEGAAGRGPTARLMRRPTMPNGDTIPYAFGLRLGAYRGLPTVARGGHMPGITSEFVRFPDQRLAVATLCNADHLHAWRLSRRVADLYLNDVMEPAPAPAPPVPAAVPIPHSELEQYVGFYSGTGSETPVRLTIIDGKLAELLSDTAATFTYRGGAMFTGDGAPNDFRGTFTRSSSSAPMKLEYSSEGQILATVYKLPPDSLWHPERSVLAEYAGPYSSGELGTWEFVVRDSGLVLRRGTGRDLPLVPIRRDVFTREFGFWAEPLVARFTFERDATGRVTSFTIATPPGDDVVRDLQFTRSR